MSRKSIKISLFLRLLLKVWFVSGQKFSFAAFTPESWSISGPAAVTSAAQWLLLSCWAPTTFHLYIQPGFKAPFTTSLSIEQMDYGSKSQQQRTEIMIQREICGERLRWPERPARLRWALSSHLFSVCLLSLTWIFCLPQNLLLFGPYYFFFFSSPRLFLIFSLSFFTTASSIEVWSFDVMILFDLFELGEFGLMRN